jgi:DNA polymerase-3 subunit epsilon
LQFERIRVLRHLFGGATDRSLAGTGEPSIQEQVELRSLLAALREHEMSDTALNDLEMAVIDTETTGFDPLVDVLLSLAAVLVDPGARVGEPFHCYVRLPADRQVPPHITELTGITEEDVRQGEPLAAALQKFLQFVGERVLVAHHAGHDVRFLNAALRKSWGVELDHHVLDTGKIAMWLHQMAKYPSLDVLLALYEIPLEGRHTAHGDAKMTAEVVNRQFALLDRQGVRTLGKLWEAMLVLEHRHGRIDRVNPGG